MMGLPKCTTRRRDLRMVWETRKAGKQSFLLGTAHFFPYQFRTSLHRYLSRAETVVLEGPLDDAAMCRVVENGSTLEARGSLAASLDSTVVLKINAEFKA